MSWKGKGGENELRLDLEALLSKDSNTITEKDLARRPSIYRLADPDTLAVEARSLIHQSAREGNVDSLRSEIEKRRDLVSYPDDDGMTPLHYAARYGRLEALKLLLRENALPNTKNMDGDTPLHIAAKYQPFKHVYFLGTNEVDYEASEKESSDSIKKIVNALIDHGADIDSANEYMLTPLHYASMKTNVAAMEALIKKKANVDALDVNEMTPLLLACVHGKQDVIQMLIKAKSDVTKRDQRLNTVFHIVALRGEPELLEMMMTNDKAKAIEALNKVNNEGKTPLRLTVEGNHPETLTKILEMEKLNSQIWMNREKELIHFAAEKGYLSVIKKLVENGGQKSELNSEKELPLHLAAKMNQKEAVEFLLDDESRDAINDYGMTPLMLAVSHDSLACVKYLIEQGADLDATDKDERSPVYIGAKYNALSSVEFILEHLKEKTEKEENTGRAKTARRADKTLRNVEDKRRNLMVNKSDRDQNSPMHVVASNGYLEMMRLLQQYDAIIEQVNEDEETPLHRAAHSGQTGAVRQLVEWNHRLLLNKDEMGNSALHLAARQGHDVTTRVLLDAGADKEAKNSFQQTPLQVAVEAGKLETCQQLVSKGASVENPSDARTGLHVAAFYGYETITRFLLQMGVTIDKRDEKGRTALDVACEQGKKDVARALLETDDWKLLMTPNDVIPLDKHKNPVNKKRKTPFRTLLAKFPELAALVMDKCVERSKEEDDLTLCIAHNFEYIDDTYMLRDLSDNGEEEQLIGSKRAYDDEFKLHKNAVAYSSNYDRIYKNHPLKLMANAEKLSLLSHPLSLALIKCKWNRLGRLMYYSALTIYLIFIISLTNFVRYTRAPYNVQNGESYYDSSFFDDNETCPEVSSMKPEAIWKRIVQILALCQIGIEVFQLYQRKLAYLTNWENWIDCFIYSTALLTVYDFSECSSTSGVRQNWQWLLAALCIFFGWINLLFMVRKMPRFGIFVVMFVDIVKTFFRFFPVFVLFIIAFSSAFYVILQNRPEFSTIFLSPLKTTVMMIGEFEFNGIFHGDQDSHAEKLFGPAHTSIAYCIFFFFCIIMTILLMNLLVGLAVDDIKGVQEKAELRRLAMQVDLVLQIEASFHMFIRRMKRYAICRYASFPQGKLHKTGIALWWSNFRKRFGLNSSSELEMDLSYDYESEFNSELRANFEMQRNRLQTLQDNVDIMYEKQVRLEALIRSLATGLDIKIEVEEND